MTNDPWKTGSPPPRRRDLTWPTPAQTLRQLGIAAAVMVVWALLLVGYLSLTRDTTSPEPTAVVVATQPAASVTPVPPTAVPPSATPEPTASPTLLPASPSPSPEPGVPTAPTEPPPTPSPTLPPEPTPTDVPPSETPEAVLVSFSQDVLPIFEASCHRCHGSSRRGGLSLQTQADVLAGSSDGPVIVPGSAADSLLVETIETGRMPRGAPRLSDEAIQIIRAWIDAGAPDN